MAGFLGGSSGSGTGGEISFPKQFIDPVTKLRVSQPETLIDTDFEYGLQPTKWETVELINNTPSFFSKSGDTTINGILAMVSTATSREIKVSTAEAHGLAVGIPINVSGSKSITADGSYIINSIPDPKTFTYLAKQNQDATASIFDLYTSIITGEFFQGSQIKISDSQGIVTNAASPSALTVQTDSPHGFQVGTPFYFLNLNSTVSQQFDASNTGAKTFDSSNSATAQSFDGSNTLTSYVINLQNKALAGGEVSITQNHSTANKTIIVLHSTETFVGVKVGDPLYYNVSAQSGYFNSNPRGVVFVADNSFNVFGAVTSTFSVSATPGGEVIDIPSYPNGTFQKANQAITFAGNNLSSLNETTLTLTSGSPIVFDGANTLGSLSTVNTFSGTIIQLNNDAGTSVASNNIVGSMVQYETTGSAASGLSNNTSYFVTFYFEPAGASVPGFYQIKVATAPGGSDITVSGGTGTQKFRKIGVAVDRDIIHAPNHGLVTGDMVKYSYPAGGAMTRASFTKDYMFVTRLDNNNVQLEANTGLQLTATGATLTNITVNNEAYKVYAYYPINTYSLVIAGSGLVEYLVVGGGGGGGSDMGGGGGAGGFLEGSFISPGGTYSIAVGGGGTGSPAGRGNGKGNNGGNSQIVGPNANIIAFGGGGGGSNHDVSANGFNNAGGVNHGQQVGSGGGAGGAGNGANGGNAGTGTSGQGFNGSSGGSYWYPGSGGGAGGNGTNATGSGGIGRQNAILGTNYYWAGGGGGSGYSSTGSNGGAGGGGGGAVGSTSGGSGLNPGSPGGGGGPNSWANTPGGNGGTNTGGGGGGGAHYNSNNYGGNGGSGIVIVRVKG